MFEKNKPDPIQDGAENLGGEPGGKAPAIGSVWMTSEAKGALSTWMEGTAGFDALDGSFIVASRKEDD